MGKKPASQNSPTAAITSTISAPFINAPIDAPSPRASSLTKRKTETRKSKLSSSLSASKIWRHSETSKGTVSCPTTASPTSHWYSESLSSSVSNKQRSNGLNNGLDIKKTPKGPFLHNYAKDASHSQNVFQSPLGSSQAMGAFKPSGLRPPSPQIRFFDENALHRNHEVTRSRKLPQKVLSGGTSFSANAHFDCLNGKLLPHSSSRYDPACKKLKSPCLEVAVNIKRTKTDHANTFHGEDKEICLETERVNDQESDSGDQLCDLSKYFEAIDLNQEKKQISRQSKRNKNNIENQLLDSPMASSKPHQLSPKPLLANPSISGMRTPLADKTSACNLSET
ncbi:hypothetical protein CDL12_10620 [Handroanthus impetiginosus]|uniref:Uncharacterized protein n=1 Tax=Handroanthus impetiginosus TaxID=429701 RepID=A0A2G9HGN1_9LAMI|nr:hypothetical protein CDL12_10620 [Handroanthus impetiginosus]